MRKKQTPARFGLLMSALALMSVPSAALAQETCTTDSDCDHGYACEEIGAGCADVDCAGDGCEPPPPCETTLGCVPVLDCTDDSDCIDGWKCITQTVQPDCAAAPPTCPDGDEECLMKADAAVADCGEPAEISACVASWNLPCTTADDCGAGFDCVERVTVCGGSSAGSGGDPAPTPAADAGAEEGFAPPADGDPIPPDEIPAPDCGEPSGEYQCQLIETTCSVDSDCGAGLTCQSFVGDSVCGGSSDVPSTPEPSTPDGGASDRIPIDCQQAEPTYACAPPSFQVSLDYGYGRDGDAVSSNDDEGGSTAGSGEPPASPSDGDGNGGEVATDDTAADAMSESSGCSAPGALAAHGGSGMLFMALAVLGLAVRRRSLRS